MIFLSCTICVRYCQLVLLFSVPLLCGIEGKVVYISSVLIKEYQVAYL
jgi:hypothetical protein